MLPPWTDPAALLDLVDQLRDVGYNVGTEQHIMVQDLVLVLIAHGESLEDPNRLRSYLAPVLCSSPQEQEELKYHFDQWVSRLATSPTSTGGEPRTVDVLQESADPSGEAPGRRLGSEATGALGAAPPAGKIGRAWRKWRPVVLGLLAVAALLFLVWSLSTGVWK